MQVTLVVVFVLSLYAFISGLALVTFGRLRYFESGLRSPAVVEAAALWPLTCLFIVCYYVGWTVGHLISAIIWAGFHAAHRLTHGSGIRGRPVRH